MLDGYVKVCKKKVITATLNYEKEYDRVKEIYIICSKFCDFIEDAHKYESMVKSDLLSEVNMLRSAASVCEDEYVLCSLVLGSFVEEWS